MDRYILQRTCRDKKKRYVVAVFENWLTGSYTWQVTDDKEKAKVYPYRDADFTASCSERPMQILPA